MKFTVKLLSSSKVVKLHILSETVGATTTIVKFIYVKQIYSSESKKLETGTEVTNMMINLCIFMLVIFSMRITLML